MSANLPEQETRKQYTGDGVNDIFPYIFKAYETSDVNVWVTLAGNSPDPIADLKVYGTDYTLTDIGVTAGGNVQFLPGKIPPLDSLVVTDRDVPNSIVSEFSNVQNFNGQNLDDQLERIVAMIQQNTTRSEFNSIRYAPNANIPTSNEAVVQTLGENQIWKKQGSNIIAATLQEVPDCSTLRTDLANNMPGSDGAMLVGYNDAGNPTTVEAKLTSIIASKDNTFITANDTTGSVANNKIVTTANITKTILNPGANEQLELAYSGNRIGYHALLKDATYATPTGFIPYDDTIPQDTEGDLIFSDTFTPKNATSTIFVRVNFTVMVSAATNFVIALFENRSANAFVSNFHNFTTGLISRSFSMTGSFTISTLDPITISLRSGSGGINYYLNGNNTNRLGGGSQTNTMEIVEIYS